jgi:D-amino peptidase
MRIVVLVDMEGITGICKREQTLPGDRLFPEACELLTGDIHATVQGLVDAGVDDIIVYDCHMSSFNAPLPPLHPAARYMRGSAANSLRAPMIDRRTDGVVLLGYHAMAGTLHAVLEHTMNSKSWFRLAVNGRAIGEIAYDAALAGAEGVPVILVSGDDKACACSRRGASTATPCAGPRRTLPRGTASPPAARRRAGRDP